ncbi:MAG: flagellar assembly protein FliX [Pseudomonadota bacterium]
MKIDPGAPVRSTPLSRVRGSSARAGVGFAELLSEPAAAKNVTVAAPISAADAMLAAQEVGDAIERNRRARERGNAMLDRLEAIRVGLLDGVVSTETIAELGRLVRDRRDAASDPRLAGLLDEIELRAAVELAKLGQDP